MFEIDELKQATNGTASTTVRHTRDLTRQQLESIRDELLGPLMMQMRHQSEEVGRLQIQCRQLRDERDALIAERDQLREQLDASSEGSSKSASSENEQSPSLITQLHTTDGAMITGIAIAMGLWLGIGVTMYMALG